MMIVAAFIVVVLTPVMNQAMQPATDNSTFGIVDFELAGTPEQALVILDAWGADGRDGAELAIKLDFGYLIAYSLLLALVCGSAAIGAARRDWRRTERAAWRLAALSLLAGLLDAAENTALLNVLGQYNSGGVSGLAPVVADTAAAVKFGIVLAALVFVAAVLVAIASSRFRQPDRA